MAQAELFEPAAGPPEGFQYTSDFIAGSEEKAVVQDLQALHFEEFKFHGFVGRRRVVSFGWRYDFNGGGLQKTDDMPAFLLPLRERAAHFAGMMAMSLQQVLLTEYRPGAAIGWHKDRSVFGDVIGISLLSTCRFRLRRKVGKTWQRASVELQPRSAYLLQGPARTEWEHSIPAVESLRYSITFRNIKNDPGRARATR
jgi:alkylated DNA repair dioxygenase AlkB